MEKRMNVVTKNEEQMNEAVSVGSKAQLGAVFLAILLGIVCLIAAESTLKHPKDAKTGKALPEVGNPWATAKIGVIR
jgi:hypothetical protein